MRRTYLACKRNLFSTSWNAFLHYNKKKIKILKNVFRKLKKYPSETKNMMENGAACELKWKINACNENISQKWIIKVSKEELFCKVIIFLEQKSL